MGKGDLRWEYVRLTMDSDPKINAFRERRGMPVPSHVMPVALARRLRSQPGRAYDSFRTATLTRASREEYVEEG